MQIRNYMGEDRARCLEIFTSNVPTYFAATDQPGFVRFMAELPGLFFVVDVERDVVACGGVAIDHPEPSIATLCWGMVASDSHQRGIGRALLDYRMQIVLTGHPSIRRVRVNTTQLVRGFFERHGFLAIHVETNGYGIGLDSVRMERELPLLTPINLAATPIDTARQSHS